MESPSFSSERPDLPPERALFFRLFLIVFAGHLAWQIVRLDIADPDRCLALFKSDREPA